MYIVILGLTGFIAGGLGAMLGLGGGILMVPLLSGALGLPIHEAIGASLVGVVATSNAGATVYLKARLANIRLGLILEPALAVGSITGGLIATLLSGQVLSGIFTLLLIYTAYTMLKPGPVEREEKGPELDEHVHVREDARRIGPLSGVLFERASGRTLRYEVRGLPIGLLMALVAGGLGGLLGIGGGLIKVPVLHLIMGVPMKAAVATSNFAMGVTASAAAFVYVSRGLVDPFVIAPVVIGVVLGAQVGSRVAERVRAVALKRVFVLVLLFMAVQMALKALGVRF